MAKWHGVIIIGGILLLAGSVWASGKDIFQQRCAACHSVGEGRRVGPDLKGAGDRHSEDWTIRFIKSSQALVKSGDKDAVKLFEENNKIVMPDQALSDDEIRSILGYIRETGGNMVSGDATAEASTPAPSTPKETTAKEAAESAATPEQIALGQDIFQGKIRLVSGGPSCNSCHHVTNDAVIGGGVLAKDLTQVFSRMGRAGVRSILGGPPFPVMQAAYANKPLKDEEIIALVAFLQDADAKHAFQRPRDYGWGLFNAGVVGVVVVFGLCALVGSGRKKKSVNQDIYDRQIKSE